MNIQQIISKAIEEHTGIKNPHLEFSSHEEFGDYTTNVALINGLNPKDLVDKLKKDARLMQIVDKIETADPGFINFTLKKEMLINELQEILKQKNQYGTLKNQNSIIMVEFAHPNTHKAFHIGHLRNITTGESISRLVEAVGNKVVRVNYQGDVGLHIAKAIWGIKKLGFNDTGTIKGRTEFLAKAYVEGNRAYEEDETAKNEIIEINKALYEGKDKELIKIYQTTRKWSLDYFDTIYKRVETKFDRFYFESEVAQRGKEIALDALKKGILTKSDGAIVFKGEEEGLHTRVFITRKDTPTYEGKELGLAELEFSEFKPSKIIHIVGPEQSGYFQVLFRVIEKLDPAKKGKEIHLTYGWVKLKEGKMSSRKGNVVLGEWLLDEVKKQIADKYKTPEIIAEQIAVGAVKYSFLKTSLNQEIAFDIKESISIEGNSGPYLQYTFARTQSVLEKSSYKSNKFESSSLNNEELSVLRKLSQYCEVISMSAKSYSPNLLCLYLFELAQTYNNFYALHRIINNDFRLALTAATSQVLKNGLTLLGISTPEKM